MTGRHRRRSPLPAALLIATLTLTALYAALGTPVRETYRLGQLCLTCDHNQRPLVTRVTWPGLPGLIRLLGRTLP